MRSEHPLGDLHGPLSNHPRGSSVLSYRPRCSKAHHPYTFRYGRCRDGHLDLPTRPSSPSVISRYDKVLMSKSLKKETEGRGKGRQVYPSCQLTVRRTPENRRWRSCTNCSPCSPPASSSIPSLPYELHLRSDLNLVKHRQMESEGASSNGYSLPSTGDSA